MTKRKCLLVGWVGLCCLAACGGMSYAQENDPAINDKPLSQWIKQLRGDNRGFQLRAHFERARLGRPPIGQQRRARIGPGGCAGLYRPDFPYPQPTAGLQQPAIGRVEDPVGLQDRRARRRPELG